MCVFFFVIRSHLQCDCGLELDHLDNPAATCSVAHLWRICNENPNTHSRTFTLTVHIRAHKNNIPVIHRSVVWLRVWETFTSCYVEWRFDESNYTWERKNYSHTHGHSAIILYSAQQNHMFIQKPIWKKNISHEMLSLLFKLFGVTLAPAAVSVVFFFPRWYVHICCVYSRQFLRCVFLTDFGM